MSEILDWFEEMELRPFNLQFKGELHADQTGGPRRRLEIQTIRRALHAQLPRTFRLIPVLRRISNDLGWDRLPYRGEQVAVNYKDGPGLMRRDDAWARIPRRNGAIWFVPLVVNGPRLSMICELDIRILWMEKRQGGILRGQDGFDIDSRIKGIVDALSIPQDNQLPDDISSEPNPCLCLLENDNLVTRLAIQAQPITMLTGRETGSTYIECQIDVQVHADGLGEEV